MSQLRELAGRARRIELALRSGLVARRLEQFSADSFRACCREGKELYARIPKMRDTGLSAFEHTAWGEFDAAVAQYFLSDDFDWWFLRQPVIGKTMFVRAGGRWQREQLHFLQSIRPLPALRRLLRENRLGGPYITSLRMLASHNTIHHLYHVLRYEHVTQQSLATVGSVVEFGGGYGNLARVMLKLNPELTYTIIDLPVFSAIQLAYLGTILGRDRIHMAGETGELAPHKINLLPLPYLERARDLKGELFVSTWALSECTQLAQRYVAGRSFFGARHLLLAYQAENALFGSPDASLIEPAGFSHVVRERIEFIRNAHYLFA
jgi:hypothetical protein